MRLLEVIVVVWPLRFGVYGVDIGVVFLVAVRVHADLGVGAADACAVCFGLEAVILVLLLAVACFSLHLLVYVLSLLMFLKIKLVFDY
jgi:hypothetical protein